MSYSNYDEMRDRIRLLDQTLAENQELKSELATLKSSYQQLKENNIYAQERKAKAQEEHLAMLEHREKVHGISRDKPLGFWEHMQSRGIVPSSAPRVTEERNRNR
jgi:hypothetical protein